MFRDETLQALRSARKIAVLTGAGVSAESGVPTFRGAGGLWRTYDATRLATPEAFARDPKLVWEFYDYRRAVLSPLKPNPGHYALRAIEERCPEFALLTQNIDNLHRAAGSENIVELHGNIWRLRCTNASCENSHRTQENRDVPLRPLPPLCGLCGALLRPHVTWFGERLNPGILEKAMAAVSGCDFLLVAGTSAVVQPAAGMPRLALEGGAYVLEVNPERTGLSGAANESVQAPSGEALPRLLQSAFGGP